MGSLAVLAGIAATEAICGHALARRAAGENHDEAIVLMTTATTQGHEFARELVKYARRLADGMGRLLLS